jgi:hypothetical protein
VNEAHSVTEIAVDEAERRAGHRLDRRRRYAWDGATVCSLSTWTQSCSGCSCDCGDGYPCDHEPYGCDECGHTGKRRRSAWIPDGGQRKSRAKK